MHYHSESYGAAAATLLAVAEGLGRNDESLSKLLVLFKFRWKLFQLCRRNFFHLCFCVSLVIFLDKGMGRKGESIFLLWNPIPFARSRCQGQTLVSLIPVPTKKP